MFNLVAMQDLTNEEILELIKTALSIKQGKYHPQYPHLFIANLFFENSTRTKCSFEVAEKKLGMQVINFDVSTSSINKGESLYDTCKTLESIGCQILIIRHSTEHYYQQLTGLNIPIISGGDGSGEHPSQCLLDLMTIYEEFGYFKGLRVAICGDIKNSRVARSNYYALTRLGARVYFVGPEIYEDTDLGRMQNFDQLLKYLDVCMLLRIQHERHTKSSSFTAQTYHQQYGLTNIRYQQLSPHSIILHPAPVNRDVEIACELVEAPKSRIFKQMTNGMFMRQAIIDFICKRNKL